jgi:predicted RNA-binding Zn-ribbon protein involved in translation (DUF1610 family)
MDPTSPTATYRCGACGGVAAKVVLVAPGQRNPRLGTVAAAGGQLFIDGGPVSVTMAPVPMEQVVAALESGNAAELFAIDREYAPFWCPKCGASYCRDHFRAKQAYVQGFPMSIHGTCPKGHRRTLKA